MRTKTIDNPGGAWTAGATYAPAAADPDGQLVAMMVNNSGGSLAVGDVLVNTGVGGINVTTTTTANDVSVIGVVGETPGGGAAPGSASSGVTYADGTIMPVVVEGPARVNIGAKTISAGDILTTSTTAKVAQKQGAAADTTALQALVGTRLGYAKEADGSKDANNTIRCHIHKM